MIVELDSRHPLLPKAGCENEDLTLILGGSAFNAGVKEKNKKTNKIRMVKNQKLATCICFPFGNI